MTADDDPQQNTLPVPADRSRLPELPAPSRLQRFLDRLVDGLKSAAPQAVGMLELIKPGLGWISVGAAFLVDAGVPSLAEARAHEFVREHLVPRIEELATEVQEVKDRFTAPVAIDVTTQSIQASTYTDDADKYELLASAAITVLANAEWDARADRARMLMRLLTDLTVTEWRILELFADPRRWQERHHPLTLSARDDKGRVLIGAMVLEALPDLAAADPDAVYTALNALESQGLLDVIGSDEPTSALLEESALDPHVSVAGKQLLDFSPPR